MTGFAARSTELPPHELVWEIRSVNHRYLDLGFRLPEEFKRLEPQLRDIAAQRIKRGKVDCSLRIALAAAEPQTLVVDTAALDGLRTMEQQVLAVFPQAQRLGVNDILRFSGVLGEPERNLDALEAALLESFEAAVAALAEARQSEGRRIGGLLEQRVAAIETAVAEARPLAAAAEQRYREKLLERIERLGQEAQPERLEQELAMIAQRMDITEELDRLGSHAEEIRSVLRREEPIGRRLDFLIQELNREANTMSSKAQDEALTKIAVELKVLIEQMREQVQNLE